MDAGEKSGPRGDDHPRAGRKLGKAEKGYADGKGLDASGGRDYKLCVSVADAKGARFEDEIRAASSERESAEDEAPVEAERCGARGAPEVGQIVVSEDPRARSIVEGFRLTSMVIRDGDSGRLMWEERDWAEEMFTAELEAHLPAEILQLRAVSREINFSSAHEISRFRLMQKLIVSGVAIETWSFRFGFVIPGSSNSWQQVIEGADQMIPAEQLSGNLVIETSFFDGDLFLCKTLVRVFYD